MNYIKLFSKAVNKCKNNIALIQDERKITYKELDILSSQIAGKLKAKGLKKGDFIAIRLPRGIEFVASYLGVLKAGMCVVPLSLKYPQDRVDFIMSHCEASTLIDESFFADITSFEGHLDLGGDEGPALLIYTSGSTGVPKGILHTNKNLAYMVKNTLKAYKKIANKSFASLCEFSFALFVDDYLVTLSLGCEIHIINDELKISADLLQKYLKNHKIHAALLPPAVLSLFSKAPKLKVLYTASERLSGVYYKNMLIKNFYGMSEIGLVSNFELDKSYKNTPIGKGFGDLELLVMDENGKKVKAGKSGEIVVKGNFSTQYFKDDEKSAKTFVKKGAKTLVFTGDLGSKDKNGNVTLSGRKDWMVKIHGQRVEIYEIESTLKSIESVRECAVKAFCDESGQNYLAAFVVCEANAKTLRSELAKSLMEYMIPRYFVFMDTLPKNTNGKIDRKALSEPKIDQIANKKDFIAPKSKDERELCAAFASALGVANVGLNDDFTALGGDSLAAASIAASAKIKGISASLITKEKTPQNILKACAKLKSLDNDQTSAKLSQLQEYMRFIDRTAGVTSFRAPFYLKLPQSVDISRFKKALNSAFLEHKIFSTKIKGSKLVYKKENLALEERKIDNLESFFSSFLAGSFDLARDRLYRFCLCLCEGAYYLVCDVHHIIIDGTSLGVFARDIARFYNDPEAKNDPELLAFSKNYAKIIEKAKNTPFAHDVKNLDSSPKGDITSPEQVSKEYLIEKTLANSAQIMDFCAKNKITPDSLLVSVYALSVLRASGASECELTYSVSGRHHKDLERSVGLFIEDFPIHFKNAPLKEMIATKELYARNSSFLSTLLSDNIKVGYVYEDDLFEDIAFGDEKMELNTIKTEFKGISLYMMVFRKNGAFNFILRYNREVYTKGFVEDFWASFCAILDDFLSGKEKI